MDRVCTFPTELTDCLVEYRLAILHCDRTGRTDLSAAAAARTFLRVILKLLLITLCLRVVTPFALERTAFEKYGCADSVTIMYRKFLNVGNQIHRTFVPFF